MTKVAMSARCFCGHEKLVHDGQQVCGLTGCACRHWREAPKVREPRIRMPKPLDNKEPKLFDVLTGDPA